MTQTQARLWKLADAELRKIGGIGRITRNPDESIRDRADIEGTREWALVESMQLSNPGSDAIMTDERCQRLINIINGGVI
jgi:hypothetical protein